MIPVTLRLSNFMSYGAQAPVLDFEAFHVACLSGNNGQGKSALLDAITWAPWGRARKTTGRQNPSPDLLRTSEREMSVEFEFDAEGERYRVVRTYAESQKGSKTLLELHGHSASDDTYRPLFCATIAETGERITRVLGIDYNTFINSAFLLQGRSDEFTKKAPGKRKEVLSNILNLGRYEELRALAQDHVREAVRAIAWREADINRLGAAEKKIPGWKAEQTRLQADVSLKEAERTRAREEEQALAGRVQRLESQRQEVRHLLACIVHQDLESPGLEVFVGNGSQSGNANADPRFLKRLVGGSKRCFGHASSGKQSVCSPTRASWIHVSSNHKVESINLWNRSGHKVSMEVRQPWWRAQRHASC